MTTGELAPQGGLPFGPPGVLVTKLHAPVVRDQTVVRQRLLDALQPRPAIKLTVVAAPAGYGKSTLLAMWRELEASRRSAAWVTLDERDNDPVVLWLHIMEALTRACAGVAEYASSALLAGAPLEEVVLPRLVNDLADADDVALILDDFHRLSNAATRHGVRWLSITHRRACNLSSRHGPSLRWASVGGGLVGSCWSSARSSWGSPPLRLTRCSMTTSISDSIAPTSRI